MVYVNILVQEARASAAKALTYPNSKVHGANMGPIWGRQDPGGPHVGPMNFVIWVAVPEYSRSSTRFKIKTTAIFKLRNLK